MGLKERLGAAERIAEIAFKEGLKGIALRSAKRLRGAMRQIFAGGDLTFVEKRMGSERFKIARTIAVFVEDLGSPSEAIDLSSDDELPPSLARLREKLVNTKPEDIDPDDEELVAGAQALFSILSMTSDDDIN